MTLKLPLIGKFYPPPPPSSVPQGVDRCRNACKHFITPAQCQISHSSHCLQEILHLLSEFSMFMTSMNFLQPLNLGAPAAAPEAPCIRYSLDGKEASLVNVSFDEPSNLLWMSSLSLPAISLDLFQLKVLNIRKS